MTGIPRFQTTPFTEGSMDYQESIVREMLLCIGEDPDREGLMQTPNRVVRSWRELFNGYNEDPAKLLVDFGADQYSGLVLLKNIEFYSMCEHHMLPFIGTASIAYIPGGGRVLGVSKLARLLDIYTRRLQIQERIGEQVTNFLMESAGAKGAACVIHAVHMCMQMRGCEKKSSTMVTSSIKGALYDDPAARAELMSLLQTK